MATIILISNSDALEARLEGIHGEQDVRLVEGK